MFHQVFILGHVGQDPEMRYTPDGTPVTNISVATKDVISKKNGRDGGERPCPGGWKESYNGKGWEKTTWYRVSCWRGLAEVVNNFVSKGDPIFVVAELAGEVDGGTQNPRVWQGNDGEARASYEVTARTVKLLGSRDGGGGAPIGEAPPDVGGGDDTLPF